MKAADSTFFIGMNNGWSSAASGSFRTNAAGAEKRINGLDIVGLYGILYKNCRHV